MRRLLASLSLLVAAAAILLGCGGHDLTVNVNAVAAGTATVAAPSSPRAPACDPAPGHGTMGICSEPHAPLVGLNPIKLGIQLLPDVSEYQGCALFSPAIFRIYESGTDREDRNARCHAAELARKHVWAAAYFFARNKSCSYQVARVTAIGRQYPVIRVMVVDAETYLAPGLVSCMVRELRARRWTVVTYTGSGTWPGGAIITPWWAASYGARPQCTGGVCRYVAWQFSENANCRGVFGDCSIDYGITRLNPPGPGRPLRHYGTYALIRHRHSIRVYLASHGCRKLEHEHVRRGPNCRHAEGAGREINRELAFRHIGPRP